MYLCVAATDWIYLVRLIIITGFSGASHSVLVGFATEGKCTLNSLFDLVGAATEGSLHQMQF